MLSRSILAVAGRARRLASRGYTRGASDPWMKVKVLPDETLSVLADVLDTRAAEPAQERIRLAVMEEALHDKENAAVCEVGCGTGAVARHIANLPGVDRVIGIDPSPLFLSRASSVPSTVDFTLGVGTALPIPDASQDVVVMWTLLAHIPENEQPATLAEARRVLKPGGRIVLFDNDVCSWTFGIRPGDPMQRAIDALTHAYIADPYLARKFPSLLESAGFAPGVLSIHPTVAAAADTHGHGMVQRGIDLLASSGEVDEAEADRMRAEASSRLAARQFNALVTYGSCVGSR